MTVLTVISFGNLKVRTVASDKLTCVFKLNVSVVDTEATTVPTGIPVPSTVNPFWIVPLETITVISKLSTVTPYTAAVATVPVTNIPSSIVPELLSRVTFSVEVIPFTSAVAVAL